MLLYQFNIKINNEHINHETEAICALNYRLEIHSKFE